MFKNCGIASTILKPLNIVFILLIFPLVTFSLHAKGPDISAHEQSCVISEALVEEANTNLPNTLSAARAVPYFKHGDTIGLRFFAIKSGSFWDTIGIRNGDILQRIGDKATLSPDTSHLLDPVTILHKERALTLELLRGTTPYSVTYRVEKNSGDLPKCAFLREPRPESAPVLSRNPMREEIVLRNVPTEKALEFLSTHSGKKFSTFPKLSGRVTISVQSLTSPDAEKLLDTVLLVHGHAALQEKDGIWIARQIESKDRTIEALRPAALRITLQDGGFVEILFSDIVTK